jgi:hypothetical protein
MIHFELIFIEDVSLVSQVSFFWSHGCPVVPVLYHFTTELLLYFCHNQLSIFVCVYFWVLYSVPFTDMFIYLPILHCITVAI